MVTLIMPVNTKVITGGQRVELRGTLPGEHAARGESLSIPAVAYDGRYRRDIVLTKKIGAGGEGSVFETDVGDASHYVAKIYLRDKLTDTKCAKLELMIARGIECEGVCFPVALIKNEKDETVGFLMPRAKGYELGKSVFLPKLLHARFPQWTRKDTIQLCLTILYKIKYLNDRDIILGDINGQNILVASPTEVYFVDCDSYQIGGYPCPAGTVHFTPPEAQGRNYATFLRTQAMENFAIATLLFMIMLPGKAPYSAVGGTDPARSIKQGNFPYESDDCSKVPPGKWGYIWSHMSYNTRQAFVMTFRKDGEYFEPEKRMSADGWIEVFEKYWHGIDYMLENDPMAMDIFPTRLKMRECKKCGKRYIPRPDRHVSLCDDCYTGVQARRREEERRKLAQQQKEQRLAHEKWLGEVWQSYSCKNPGCHNVITLYNRDRNRAHLPEYCWTCQQQLELQHNRWLREVWKSYPCKNPKCHNVITLHNWDRGRKRIPEYCQECWQKMPCRKCGYVAAKWMHDERGGLCRKCYEKEQREKRLERQRAANLSSAEGLNGPAALNPEKSRINNDGSNHSGRLETVLEYLRVGILLLVLVIMIVFSWVTIFEG